MGVILEGHWKDEDELETHIEPLTKVRSGSWTPVKEPFMNRLYPKSPGPSICARSGNPVTVVIEGLTVYAKL